MGLPIDLEEVVGAAVADLLRRMAMLWGCLVLGWFLALTAILMVEMLDDLRLGWFSWSDYSFSVGELFFGFLFGGLLPVLNSWGLLYCVALLGFLFWLFKADAPSVWVFVVGTGIVGLFCVLTFTDFDSPVGWVTAVVWGTEFAGLCFAAKILGALARKRAEEHFMTIAAENDRRRRAQEAAEAGDAYPGTESVAVERDLG